MDGAVPQRLGQCVVDETVLVEERDIVEARRRHGHLEVVAAAGAVLDLELGGIRECALEQTSKPFCCHEAMVAANFRSVIEMPMRRLH